jgi:superfamily II DNA/RNA helicase
MIFTRTKRTAQRVADDLSDRGFAVAAVHGDLGQGAREQALRAFRSEKVDVLVATDVAARGIDVTGVTHVVNYQCPEDAKTYIHRIGRTGRAGREGVAVTLVDWDEIPRWKTISDDLGLGIDEPVETYSTSDHLFAELGIPTEAGSRLPRASRTRAGLNAEYIDDDGPRGRRDKRRGRTGTSRGSGGGRHSGETSTDDAPETGAAARAARPPRQRRRRRAGVESGAEESSSVTATGGSAEVEVNSEGPDTDGGQNGGVNELSSAGRTGGTRRRPRRRRRSGGSGSSDAPDAAAS